MQERSGESMKNIS